MTQREALKEARKSIYRDALGFGDRKRPWAFALCGRITDGYKTREDALEAALAWMIYIADQRRGE